jgi:PAS domain S-box-containing protein
MPSTTAQLGFPRRIVALYLLFSLGSLLLLASGSVLAVQAILKSRATTDALSQVSRLTSSITLDQLATSGANGQSLVERARLEGQLAWCAVVDRQGKYVAHTDRSLIGATMIEPIGAPVCWGATSGIAYRNQAGLLVNEYRTPLMVNQKPAGSLVIAFAVPGWQSVSRDLAGYAPLAILAPVVVIAVGGWWLSRTTGPLSEISQALSAIARLPIDTPPHGKRISAKTLAAIGWNRIVDNLEEQRTSGVEGVASRLSELVGASGGGKTRAALESLSEGIAVTDAQGRIEFANRAVAALLCCNDSLDGQSLDELLATVAPESAAAFIGDSLQAEVISEMKVATPVGDRTLRLSRAPLAGDTTPGHVWSVRDITQQKLTEASRDQFIDTATHELRTPLANIKAYAETLAMGDMIDIEEQKEFCNTINAEATRLARFVDDLLSISSLEVGSLGIQRTNVDVRRLLEEAAEKVKPLMKQRSMTFEVTLSEKLGEARIDKDKVSGMIVNLLGNAAKYTPEGGTVTLAAIRQDDQLKIEVRDTGVGIAEEEAEQVFEKFFRSANPAVRDNVGTGLGLPLAREIARLHRGDITLASKLGEGSTFTALLPVQ